MKKYLITTALVSINLFGMTTDLNHKTQQTVLKKELPVLSWTDDSSDETLSEYSVTSTFNSFLCKRNFIAKINKLNTPQIENNNEISPNLNAYAETKDQKNDKAKKAGKEQEDLNSKTEEQLIKDRKEQWLESWSDQSNENKKGKAPASDWMDLESDDDFCFKPKSVSQASQLRQFNFLQQSPFQFQSSILNKTATSIKSKMLPETISLSTNLEETEEFISSEFKTLSDLLLALAKPVETSSNNTSDIDNILKTLNIEEILHVLERHRQDLSQYKQQLNDQHKLMELLFEIYSKYDKENKGLTLEQMKDILVLKQEEHKKAIKLIKPKLIMYINILEYIDLLISQTSNKSMKVDNNNPVSQAFDTEIKPQTKTKLKKLSEIKRRMKRGESSKKIADDLDIPIGTLYSYSSELGLRFKENDKLLMMKEAKRRYDNGETPRQIAHNLNKNVTTIYRYLRYQNIKLKTNKQVILEDIKKRYDAGESIKSIELSYSNISPKTLHKYFMELGLIQNTVRRPFRTSKRHAR